jgi:high-affinity K+ transport system ATPase subunit B
MAEPVLKAIENGSKEDTKTKTFLTMTAGTRLSGMQLENVSAVTKDSSKKTMSHRFFERPDIICHGLETLQAIC